MAQPEPVWNAADMDRSSWACLSDRPSTAVVVLAGVGHGAVEDVAAFRSVHHARCPLSDGTSPVNRTTMSITLFSLAYYRFSG